MFKLVLVISCSKSTEDPNPQYIKNNHSALIGSMNAEKTVLYLLSKSIFKK